MNVVYITLSKKGGMIHYIRQLIGHLPETVSPVLITRLIPDTIPRTTCCRFGLEPATIVSGYQKIVRAIEASGPDIIHVTTGHILLIPLLRKFRHIPVVVTLHDVTPHSGENTWLRRYIIACQIRHAAHIFVHGRLQKEALIAAGVPENRISVIPHGDFSFFTRYRTEGVPEEDAVLFFGRIVAYKGLGCLLDAMARVREKMPVKLIIAGEGSLASCRDMLAGIGGDQIEIHNRYIGDAEVAGFFQRAKVVVLPYTDGSQTGVVPIAYAFGKPVIASDVGSFAEAVDDGKTGLLIPPNDPGILCDAILGLIPDDTRRREMGACGQRKLERDLSWDAVIKETVSVYSRVTGGKD